MNPKPRLSSKLFLAAAALCTLTISTAAMRGQSAPGVSVGSIRITGVPEDWSHHHVVFSNPGTEEDAIRKGTYDQWTRIVNEPRYVMQQLKRGLPAQGYAAQDVAYRNLQAQLAKHKGTHTQLNKDWSMGLDGSASAGTAAMGPNQYPAKYDFGTSTGACGAGGDFVVYSTGLAGSGTQATIIAYDNLYVGGTGCGTTNPTTYWAYNTGGTATLSPVIYWDGSKVAYIQTSGGVASLVLLKWSTSGGTIGAPATIPTGSFPTCSAPCYTTITLHGSTNDTNSAPFYDYGHDILYVGDNSGNLHKFTPVFDGPPAEVTTGGWPISVSTNILSGPVYDSGASTNIFVADSGGFLYGYKASTAAKVMQSSKLTYASGTVGIVDAPLLDSTAQKVYVFVGDDSNTSTSVGCDNVAGSGCSGVFQFAAGNTTIASAGTVCAATANSSPWPGTGINCGGESIIGTGTTATPTEYAGTFDQTYYNNQASGQNTVFGNLWGCYQHAASQPRLSFTPLLSGGSIVSGTNAISIAGTAITTLTSAIATCSPTTEFLGTKATTTLTAAITTTTTTTVNVTGTAIATNDYIQIDSEFMKVTGGGGTGTLTVTRGVNGTVGATHLITAPVNDVQDWLFLSVSANSSEPGCTVGSGCLYNVNVIGGGATLTATAGIITTAGTSGIVVDNSSTAAGESQIYYTTQGVATCAGNGTTGSTNSRGCAVQASQSNP